MEFGYPGANTNLENHGVSEESFWPSFTDIMMVIVMVFLLVTVAVILNNWSLIGDLKNSIEAQKVASSLAENRLVENDSLGSKLSQLEKQIVFLNKRYDQEKTSFITIQESLAEKQQALSESQQALTDNQTELSQAQLQVTEKNSALAMLQTELKTLNDNLASEQSSRSEAQQKLTISQQQLTEKETIFAKLQTDFADVIKQKAELIALNKSHNNTIAENEKTQQSLREELNTSELTITSLEKKQKSNGEEVQALKKSDEIKTQVLASLQLDRSKLENALGLLKSDYAKSQEATQNEIASAEEIRSKLAILKKKQQKQTDSTQAATHSVKMAHDALNQAQVAIKELEEEKQRIISTMDEKLAESEKKASTLAGSVDEVSEKLKAKETEILALKDNKQLLSLQGKYDTLDAKYQKLLRPARSSKGKFIVSVTYKKRGGKRIIRLKQSPAGSYKTVTKQQLHKVLAKLKTKHKADLYIKVIIPETSGLSYSEAWKFTSNLQKKYDYYHQPDSSK